MSPYYRTAEQKQADFHESKVFEAEVRRHLPAWTVDRTNSTSELDYWIPGTIIEVKEKRQPLTDRWLVLPGVAERDLFVLDELSLRKGMAHWPGCYFVLRDVPGGRIFLASITELCVVERERRMRVGKGKVVYNLTQFRLVPSLEHLVPMVMADLAAMPWKVSECLGALPVEQV